MAGDKTVQDPVWKAYAIRYMSQPERRPAREMYLDGRDDEPSFPGLEYYFWVLLQGERAIVVDTGMSEDDAQRAGRRWLGSPADLLKGIGISADQVRDVVITHAHTDHVGNLAAFPAATFWIQREEMVGATGPEMTVPLFRHVFSTKGTMELVRLLYEGRLRFLDGDGTFAPGIRYQLIGGHSRGQMILDVDTSRGPVVLASDAIHLYDEARLERPFFAFHDLLKMVEGYRRCLSLAGGPERLVVGHDVKVLEAYPSVPGFEGLIVDLTAAPDMTKID